MNRGSGCFDSPQTHRAAPQPRRPLRAPSHGRGMCAYVSTLASSSTAIAALRPLSAITLPAGCVAAPHRYKPGDRRARAEAVLPHLVGLARPGRCSRP